MLKIAAHYNVATTTDGPKFKEKRATAKTGKKSALRIMFVQ
jgi:hypothetical protein